MQADEALNRIKRLTSGLIHLNLPGIVGRKSVEPKGRRYKGHANAGNGGVANHTLQYRIFVHHRGHARTVQCLSFRKWIVHKSELAQQAVSREHMLAGGVKCSGDVYLHIACVKKEWFVTST